MNKIKPFIFAILVQIAVTNMMAQSAYALSQKLLHAAIAEGTDSKPATIFSPDVPKLYAFYIGDALKEGDVLRGVWIAEDVGSVAPKNSKIDEASVTAKTATDQGAFSLSKPTNGWPIGSYRVEIYVGDQLAETVKFEITKPMDSKSDKVKEFTSEKSKEFNASKDDGED